MKWFVFPAVLLGGLLLAAPQRKAQGFGISLYGGSPSMYYGSSYSGYGGYGGGYGGYGSYGGYPYGAGYNSYQSYQSYYAPYGVGFAPAAYGNYSYFPGSSFRNIYGGVRRASLLPLSGAAQAE